jgi:acyl-CoA thioester hydrolase
LIEGNDGRPPAAFVVRRMTLEFLRPARIDEILEVTTRVKETTAASLILDQRISRDGVGIFGAEVMVVLVAATGKPLRLSTALRDALHRATHFTASGAPLSDKRGQ